MSRLRTLLRDLSEAVRGSEMDYTQGSIGRAILLLSVPMMLEMLMESTFAVVDVYFVSSLAGYTIAVRIFVFTLMPAWGLSNAAATLVGQNLGAKQPERAERSVWIAGFVTMSFLAVVSLVYIICNEFLVRIFTSEPAVVAAGAECLRVVSYGYVFFAWGLVMPQAFNGAGDTLTPTKINFVCFWLLEIPLAYFLALELGAKATGVYWSIVIAETSVGLVAIWLFRKGGWKQTRV